jgi:hypothetical protein
MNITLEEITLAAIRDRRRATAVPHSYCWSTRGTYISYRDPAEIVASGREIQALWRWELLGMARRGYDSFLVYMGETTFAQIDLDPYTDDVWCKLYDAWDQPLRADK